MNNQILLFVTILSIIAVKGRGLRGTQNNDSAINTAGEFVLQGFDCLYDKSPCDKLGRHIKELLPDYLHNNCVSCDPVEKKSLDAMREFVEQNYPIEWKNLKDYYLQKNFESNQEPSDL